MGNEIPCRVDTWHLRSATARPPWNDWPRWPSAAPSGRPCQRCWACRVDRARWPCRDRRATPPHATWAALSPWRSRRPAQRRWAVTWRWSRRRLRHRERSLAAFDYDFGPCVAWTAMWMRPWAYWKNLAWCAILKQQLQNAHTPIWLSLYLCLYSETDFCALFYYYYEFWNRIERCFNINDFY